MKTLIRNLALLTGFLVVAAGCSTSKVVSSWSAPGASPESMKKVVVASLAGSKYPGLQQEIEEGVLQRLLKEGIVGVSAVELFGPNEFKGQSEENIARKLKEHGFTSILLVSLLDKKKETRYNAGSSYLEPVSVLVPRMRPYSWRYATVYNRVYTPGYYSSSTKYILDAQLFSIVDNDKLLYSSQIDIGDPQGSKSFIKEFADTMVKNLQAKGIVAASAK